MSKIGQTFGFLILVMTSSASFVFMAGCQRQELAKVEKLKNNVRREIEEAWNKGNLDVLDGFYAADFVYHIPPQEDVKGLEAYKKYIKNVRTSYPDIKLTIEEIIAEGNIGAFRWTYRGTQTGESPTLGIPPTGKQVTFTGCSVFHTVNGKIVETWNSVDWLGLMQQLGFKLVPPQQAVENSP